MNLQIQRIWSFFVASTLKLKIIEDISKIDHFSSKKDKFIRYFGSFLSPQATRPISFRSCCCYYCLSIFCFCPLIYTFFLFLRLLLHFPPRNKQTIQMNLSVLINFSFFLCFLLCVFRPSFNAFRESIVFCVLDTCFCLNLVLDSSLFLSVFFLLQRITKGMLLMMYDTSLLIKEKYFLYILNVF